MKLRSGKSKEVCKSGDPSEKTNRKIPPPFGKKGDKERLAVCWRWSLGFMGPDDAEKRERERERERGCSWARRFTVV
jgi:hypothetical protein